MEHECEQGSVIHSDEWPVCWCLKSKGFAHHTVNRHNNYVDPDIRAHTQAVERSWLDAKIYILKKKRGVPISMLQSHLTIIVGGCGENMNQICSYHFWKTFAQCSLKCSVHL